MKKVSDNILSAVKALAVRLRKGYVRRPLIFTIVAAALLIIVIAIIFLCSCTGNKGHVEGTGLVLDPEGWKVNENGFRYYDREGYENLFGIDVSEWVEDIDFRALKKSGVDFVIFRVGYRGYETGRFVLDNNLASYLRGARNAGLKIGAYFVSQAVSEEEAVEEAQFVMDHVKGYDMEMPLYIDLEEVYDTARTDRLTTKQRTKIVQAFCGAVEEQGYRGGVYANEVWFTDRMEFEKICQYDIWLARYIDTLVTDLPINMWQYTDRGEVEGTPMWVDLDTRVTKTEIPEETETQEPKPTAQETETQEPRSAAQETKTREPQPESPAGPTSAAASAAD